MTFNHFLNVYIRCTASHQRTSVNLTNVSMICKRPSKESERCLLFAGSLHPSGQYQQSGILSQLWRNIFTKLQMTKLDKVQKRPDFKKLQRTCQKDASQCGRPARLHNYRATLRVDLLLIHTSSFTSTCDYVGTDATKYYLNFVQ